MTDWEVIHLPGHVFADCYEALAQRGLTPDEIGNWFRDQNIAPYAFFHDEPGLRPFTLLPPAHAGKRPVHSRPRGAKLAKVPTVDRLTLARERERRRREKLTLARERERRRREKWGHGGLAPATHSVPTGILMPDLYPHPSDEGWLITYVASVLRGDTLPELLT